MPHFFGNGSETLITNSSPCNEVSGGKKHRHMNYTLINNMHYAKGVEFFDRLIKIYVDVILHSEKYPEHVQQLHIFGKNLLEEKVENVRRSNEHKKRLLGGEEPKADNLNEYLVHLNRQLAFRKNENIQLRDGLCDGFGVRRLAEGYQDKVAAKVGQFYNCRNVIYALFTVEHTRILFNYSEISLIRDLQLCFVNSAVNGNREIYRYIRKNGHDNVYIYILECANNMYIVKRRYDAIKKLFIISTEHNKRVSELG
ncbi:conserved Plasmodium protein, unknown function [Plasmodium ovale]|uniref:Uncharacterized protein n=1 Tax=Plasmodium ovale TaxID=36330 RepID=A0A1D3KY83_PLAOA|nr:conserved Plasmodium protein, unknown function [Plasmodium ovale]